MRVSRMIGVQAEFCTLGAVARLLQAMGGERRELERDFMARSQQAVSSAVAVEGVDVGAREGRSIFQLYMELSKARLSAMVVVTTGLGYVVASRATPSPGGFDWMRLLWTCVGTFLAAAGAAAFNQAWEAKRDGRMNRTKNRPIPSGELSRTHAAFFGLLATIAGVAILCPTSNGLTAILALANVLIYVLVYTPLKPVSSVNTLVGAVVGAIPPMMGWVAVTGTLDAGAWVLGGILFVWQIPHFLALAWMYRADYARGGYKMLSVTEPSGRLTTRLAVMYSLLLIPLCLALVYLGNAGVVFGVLSTVFGVGLVGLAVRFAVTRGNGDAKRLFLATIVYLPLLTGVLCVDARGPQDRMLRVQAGYVSPTDVPYVDPAVGR
jgi:heme o synthase